MSNVFNGASVINIPSGFKAGKLYSIVPNSGAGDLAVTRADANGSRVNPQGLIEFVAANVPRIDFLDGCPKLLVEPSRENLLLRSEDFTTTWATAASATVTGNTTAAPDGATTADTISLAAVVDSRVTQTFTLANSTTYTLSCFFKNDSLTAGQTFDFRLVNNTVAPNNFQMRATIDLAAGSVVISDAGTAGTGISGTATGDIVDYGNGWYRVYVTATTGSNAASAIATVEIISSNARQFFAWGAQLEEASYATSYIKTEATTQTRNADVISQTGLASLIGDSEGTLYVEAEVLNPNISASNYISFNDGSINNIVAIGIISTQTPRFQFAQGGAAQAVIDSSTSVGTSVFKIAVAYAVNDFVLYQDGVQAGTDTSGSTFVDGTLTAFGLNYSGSFNPFYGKISVLAWWQARLDNDVLESLTSYETYEEMAATLDYTID